MNKNDEIRISPLYADECSKFPEKPDIQKAKKLLSESKRINETRLSFEISHLDTKSERIVCEIIAHHQTGPNLTGNNHPDFSHPL